MQLPRQQEENRSAGSGGGLSQCAATIQNNFIAYNNAVEYGGGIHDCDGAIIRNNTLWANHAEVRGGGFFDCDDNSVIENCVIWANTAPVDPQLDNDTSLPTYSCIENWSGGGNSNISPGEPGMVFPEGGDFRLLSTSPCKDAGDAISGLNEDFEGDTRPYNGSYDIGADEYDGTSIPSTPTNLTVVSVVETTVTLDWDDNDPAPANGYNVYRANRESGPYKRLNSSPVSQSTYVDSTPVRGPRYYYRVTANGSESQASNSAQGTPLRIIVIDPGHGLNGGAVSRPGFGGQVEYEGNLNYELAVGTVTIKGIKYILDQNDDDRTTVYIARTYYGNPTPYERAHFANERCAQAFLSIHFDALADVPDEDQPNQMKTLVYRLDKREEYPEGPEGQVLFDENFDQYNQFEDIYFAQGIVDNAFEAYGQPLFKGGDYSLGVRISYPLNEGHWGVLRDKTLWKDPNNTLPAFPATILEVNFIRNFDFHLKWIIGNNLVYYREQVARAIAEQLVSTLDLQ